MGWVTSPFALPGRLLMQRRFLISGGGYGRVAPGRPGGVRQRILNAVAATALEKPASANDTRTTTTGRCATSIKH
jgi:hypothetical protein